jgi:hypothetical protein
MILHSRFHFESKSGGFCISLSNRLVSMFPDLPCICGGAVVRSDRGRGSRLFKPTTEQRKFLCRFTPGPYAFFPSGYTNNPRSPEMVRVFLLWKLRAILQPAEYFSPLNEPSLFHMSLSGAEMDFTQSPKRV